MHAGLTWGHRDLPVRPLCWCANLDEQSQLLKPSTVLGVLQVASRSTMDLPLSPVGCRGG